MACDTWRRMIIDRLADELDEEDAVGLEQHLAECADCLRESERLRATLAAAARPTGWRTDTAMEEKLLGAMRTGGDRPAARDTGRRWTTLLRFPMPSYATVALIVVAVGIGFLAGRSNREPTLANLAGERVPGAQIEQSGTRPEASPPAQPQPTDTGPLVATFVDAPGGTQGFGFVAVRSDAVGIPWTAIPDSL